MRTLVPLPPDAAAAVASFVAAGLMEDREYYAAAPAAETIRRVRDRCRHLGDPQGKPGCGGRQRFACNLYGGDCTLTPCPDVPRSCAGGAVAGGAREHCPGYARAAGIDAPAV